MNYQNWKWIGDKEIGVHEDGSVALTDDAGEVINFKSAFEACTQLKEMIQWLEEEVLGERV